MKSYKPTKRNWVKLWVDEWLGGTTRFELSEKQRAIWIDLLAMAGKSRFPGVVASGKYDDGFRGYPLSYLAGTLVYNPDDFMEALQICEKYGKIRTEHRNHDGIDNLVIYINNWEKYQSEYLRQKKYEKEEEEAEPAEINDKSFTQFKDSLAQSNNKIGVLVKAFGAWHPDAPNEELEEIGGKVAGLVKAAKGDYGFVLRMIWDSASCSIAGFHINYIHGMIKGKRKELQKEQLEKVRPKVDYKPVEK